MIFFSDFNLDKCLASLVVVCSHENVNVWFSILFSVSALTFSLCDFHDCENLGYWIYGNGDHLIY